MIRLRLLRRTLPQARTCPALDTGCGNTRPVNSSRRGEAGPGRARQAGRTQFLADPAIQVPQHQHGAVLRAQRR